MSPPAIVSIERMAERNVRSNPPRARARVTVSVVSRSPMPSP